MVSEQRFGLEGSVENRRSEVVGQRKFEIVDQRKGLRFAGPLDIYFKLEG